MRGLRTLPTTAAALMCLQAVLGLSVPGAYRDAGWVRATWFGNDLVTLVVVVPILVVATALAQRGSLRGHLLRLGALGYGVYNYAFYMLGAALNAFFPIYVVSFVLSAVSLMLLLVVVPASSVASGFRPATPVRATGGYLVFVAAGLASVWLGMWAAHILGGRPTPVEPEAFRLVAALDLALMVPALASGGVLIWRRRPWGYVIATVASVQGALYLTVLSTNSVVAISRGLIEAPGELPVWGTLAAATAVAAITLVVSAEGTTGREV
ncbi:MAG: hypothetical protein ACE148_09355 [Vicinamibacterales bacterium]